VLRRPAGRRPGAGRAGAPRLSAAAAGVELTLDLAPRLAPLVAARIAGLAERAPADLSYANLWLFRRAHGWRFVDGAHPHLVGLAYDGTRHLLPLFDPAAPSITEWQALLEGHDTVFPLTAREAAALDPARFALEQRRDDADYVYPAAQFRSYSGSALQAKRNLMRQCQAAQRLEARPYAPAHQAAALAVLEGWLHDKGKGPDEADAGPCREALALAPQLGLAGFVHWADGAPAGFVLAEELQPGVRVVRFAKGLARFKGIAQHMFHHLACSGAPAPRWLNFEQDLGLPNFRRTKLSYRPALLLPKWRARLRAGPQVLAPAAGPATGRKTPPAAGR